jgi:hypothetical protein
MLVIDEMLDVSNSETNLISFYIFSESFLVTILSAVTRILVRATVENCICSYIVLLAAVKCDTREQCSDYCGRDREWQDNTAYTVPS